MRVRSALKRVCASCKLVKRGRKQFVICPANARHKQRQGYHTMTASQHVASRLSIGSPVVSVPRAMITTYTPAVATVGAATRAAMASRCASSPVSFLAATHIVSSAFAIQLVAADESEEDL